MKITNGLLVGQVLQRDKRNQGSAEISGTCAAKGDIEVRIRSASGKVLRGHDWNRAGKAEKRRFRASLTGARVGGPYLVELRIRKGRKTVDSITIADIFVGDVWILAGQSNMKGVGNLYHASKPHPKVRAFFMRDEWAIAKEGLHLLSEAVDVVHNAYGNGPDRPTRKQLEQTRKNQIKGVGPGHAFGLDMYKRRRVPQGLIACAHGGTSMAQWSPALRDQGGASFYGAMMRRYEKLGQPVAGVVWYQGESDANHDCAEIYTDKMIELVAATRADMALPRLPWLVVQIGCHAARDAEEPWNSVQEQQRCLPGVIKHLDVASAIDLELDDGIHIGARGQAILGRRLARVADQLVHKASGVKPGIALKKIELVPTPHCNVGAACASVQVTYDNVVGKLVSPGRPSGFALLNAQGEDVCGIYKTTLHGNRVLLHTNMAKAQLEMLAVSYGHGRMPFCNVTDSDGFSIAGMQAVAIDPDAAP